MQRNIWICPSSEANYNRSICNKINNQSIHMWAFNANRKNTWNQLNDGDLCIFGGCQLGGYSVVMEVVSKFIVNVDLWPFESPTRLRWKYAFRLIPYATCNILCREIRNLIGFYMTQTKVPANKFSIIRNKFIF